jgi:hypothetical protein
MRAVRVCTPPRQSAPALVKQQHYRQGTEMSTIIMPTIKTSRQGLFNNLFNAVLNTEEPVV